MLEMTILISTLCLLAACLCSPSSGYRSLSVAAAQATEPTALPSDDDKPKIPEESTLKRHFLTQLQAEIESTLHPRPTDSVLQRHYDALVAAELKNRLAG